MTVTVMSLAGLKRRLTFGTTCTGTLPVPVPPGRLFGPRNNYSEYEISSLTDNVALKIVQNLEIEDIRRIILCSNKTCSS